MYHKSSVSSRKLMQLIMERVWIQKVCEALGHVPGEAGWLLCVKDQTACKVGLRKNGEC